MYMCRRKHVPEYSKNNNNNETVYSADPYVRQMVDWSIDVFVFTVTPSTTSWPTRLVEITRKQKPDPGWAPPAVVRLTRRNESYLIIDYRSCIDLVSISYFCILLYVCIPGQLYASWCVREITNELDTPLHKTVVQEKDACSVHVLLFIMSSALPHVFRGPHNLWGQIGYIYLQIISGGGSSDSTAAQLWGTVSFTKTM